MGDRVQDISKYATDQFSNIWEGASTKSRATLNVFSTMQLQNGTNKSLPRSVEASKLSLTQQPMEYMSHLVEERHDIVVSHQRWFVGCRFGKVGDHGSKWIAALSIWQIVACKERPDSRMRVLGS
jgi:hypothetical protein